MLSVTLLKHHMSGTSTQPSYSLRNVFCSLCAFKYLRNVVGNGNVRSAGRPLSYEGVMVCEPQGAFRTDASVFGWINDALSLRLTFRPLVSARLYE